MDEKQAKSQEWSALALPDTALRSPEVGDEELQVSGQILFIQVEQFRPCIASEQNSERSSNKLTFMLKASERGLERHTREVRFTQIVTTSTLLPSGDTTSLLSFLALLDIL